MRAKVDPYVKKPMLSHAWAFSRMGLLFHAWIGSLTYGSLTYAFSRMGFFTYGSTFARMDWLSHVCFLTHGLFHVWVYFFMHGLALSRMHSHIVKCSEAVDSVHNRT